MNRIAEQTPKLLMAAIVAAIVLVIVLACQSSKAADCTQFFSYGYYKQQVAVVAPLVYHAASPGLVNEAQIRKAVREELKHLRAELTTPAKQQVKTSAFASCIKCHSGSAPAGGLVLDGETPIPCGAYWRWGEMGGLGENIPDEMKALLKSMTPQQKGEINSAMLRLGPIDRPQAYTVPRPEQTGTIE
jgi:hypothetical protein